MNVVSSDTRFDASADAHAMAAKLAALSHPVRIEILRHLSARSACCCRDVVERIDLAQSTVSQHLKVLVAAGLAVTPYAVLRPGVPTLPPDERERLGLPAFVKPARAGSSLGVSRVDDWSDLDAAIAEARRHDPKVLVESAMTGREVECGVLEFPDGRVEASPTAEIHVAGDGRFYDFGAKYTDDVATFDIPAKLPEQVEKAVRDAAVSAFTALDAQGLARVDFFVGDDESVTVNEVNTMPGFTPVSMYPQMWQAAGMSYRDLLTTLVRTALARGSGLR